MSNAPSDLVTPAAARALLARATLGLDPRPADAQVGPLQLRPHQRHAAARLRYALRHYGIALLADDVGLGKTAVALALLRDTPDAVVVVPAALRSHWTAALNGADLALPVLTAESLGRALPAAARPAPRFVVVDEAHHFRNPRARRWRALAALAADARLLLLSATPVHNRPDDLAALLALALGARARTLDAPTLARLVVRRAAAHIRPQRTPAAPARPEVAPTVWLALDDAPDVLDAVRSLPPAVAPRDGTAQPDLDRYTLVRLWASSDAALRAGLRRRRARALSLADALAARHHPTRADLAALTRGIGADPTALQLSLLAPHATPAASDPDPNERNAEALVALAAYAAALERALAAAQHAPNDAARATHLRAIRARHATDRVVAFSHSADTVRALYRALAPDGRVAMLTAAGGRIASGPIPHADVLARFAPLGQSRPEPASIERISLLLTTDVLSEGLDLRDAAAVVHLDLPWTPARLAQRTGRAVRPGSPHALVHVYAFRPPPAVARDLRLAAHARAKHQAVGLTVGATALERAVALHPDVLPPSRATRALGRLARDRALEHWAEYEIPCSTSAAPRGRRVAAVRSAVPGYLAVVATPTCLGALRVPTLLAALGGRRPTSAPHAVRRALALLARARHAAEPPPDAERAARTQLARWSRRDRARATVSTTPSALYTSPAGGRHVTRGSARSEILTRVDRALLTAPPDVRAQLLAPAAEVRDALARPLTADREQAIRDAAPFDASDAAWLAAAAGAAHVGAPATSAAGRTAHGTESRVALRALVLLVP